MGLRDVQRRNFGTSHVTALFWVRGIIIRFQRWIKSLAETDLKDTAEV